MKSLAMACTCVVLQCSWGHALFRLPNFLVKRQYSQAVCVVFIKLWLLLISISAVPASISSPLETHITTVESFWGSGVDINIPIAFLGTLSHFTEQPSGTTSVFCLLPSAVCHLYCGSPQCDHISFPPCHFSSWPLCISPSSDSPGVLWLFFLALLLAKELNTVVLYC